MSAKNILFTTLLMGALLASYGKDDAKQKNYLAKADDFFKYKSYTKSIEYYTKYLRKSPNNEKANYRMGKSHVALKHREKALPYFQKAYDINPKVEKDIMLVLGNSQQTNNQFEEAIETFNAYKTSSQADEKGIKLATRRVYECNNAIEFMKDPIATEVVNLGKNINSKEHDFSPLVSSDGKKIIFSSVRRGASSGNKNPSTGQLYADIYSSETKSGVWERALPLDQINSKNEDATVSLSQDGNTLVVFIGSGKGDLYTSEKSRKGVWSTLHSMPGPINTPTSKEASATLSKDGLTLIFSSNQKGTKGELDLFISKRKNTTSAWEVPENLGATLNTEYNEDAPFLDVDGKTLYFASEGHKGMGYYDVFRSTYDSTNNTWSEPTNLGYPINSSDDDIFFTISANGKYAYFNSIKAGGFGGHDIYRMTMPEEIMTREAVQDELVSEENKETIKEQGYVTTGSTKYKKAETKKESVASQNKNPTVIKTAEGRKITTRQLFFDFNAYSISHSSHHILNKIIKIIKKNPNAIIEVAGHTDNVGGEENNQIVSTRRSETVKRYLMKKGIDEERIKAIGYGESKPLVSNDDEIGGREINRRIEFIINDNNNIVGW